MIEPGKEERWQGARGRVAVCGFDQMPGGTRTAFREFLVFLRDHGHAVGAVPIRDRDDALPAGVELVGRIPFARGGVGWKKASSVLRAAWACSRFRPDVFVSIGLTNASTVIAFALGRGTFRICQEVVFGRSPREPGLVLASRAFDAIAPQAPRMVEEFRRQGFRRARMRWLPCFSERPSSGILARPGSGDRYRIGFFGRVVPHKGLHLVIEAMASEPSAQVVSLSVWGEGTVDGYRQLAERLGVRERVHFCGAYPSGLAGAEIMASHDALVLTSLGGEGLPLVLLEGMSYGLPLLATSVASIPDCCEGNPDAIMVEPSVEGVRKGLRELVQGLVGGRFCPSRQRHFYERHFSHGAMSARWTECLNDPTGFFERND